MATSTTKASAWISQGKVSCRFSIEVGGQTVYTECVDLDTVEAAINEAGEEAAISGWVRRFKCARCCARKAGSLACFLRCLFDGKCCDAGERDCSDV